MRVPEPTTNLTSRVSKRHVPLTCKFLMAAHFVLDLQECCSSKHNFYALAKSKLVKILCKFKFCPCSIHVEIFKGRISKPCEKESSLKFYENLKFLLQYL